MRRFIASLSAAALLAGMLVATPALATAFPAVSQPVCEGFGGTFSGGGNFKQCTVVTTDTATQAVGFGHGWRSGKVWTVVTTTTTVYTVDTGTQSTSSSSTTRCWNPGGHEVRNTIPPCQF